MCRRSGSSIHVCLCLPVRDSAAGRFHVTGSGCLSCVVVSEGLRKVGDDPAGSRRPDVCVTGLDALRALLYHPRASLAALCRQGRKDVFLISTTALVVCDDASGLRTTLSEGSGASMPWIAASACTEWQLLQVHLGVTLGRHYFTRCETVSSSGCRFGLSPSRLHACTYRVYTACMCVHTIAISDAKLRLIPRPWKLTRGCCCDHKPSRIKYLAHAC